MTLCVSLNMKLSNKTYMMRPVDFLPLYYRVQHLQFALSQLPFWIKAFYFHCIMLHGLIDNLSKRLTGHLPYCTLSFKDQCLSHQFKLFENWDAWSLIFPQKLYINASKLCKCILNTNCGHWQMSVHIILVHYIDLNLVSIKLKTISSK